MTTGASVTPAHNQSFTHRYVLHFPDHFPRQDDPHYKDFVAYHEAHRATARCFIGERIGYDYCKDEHGAKVVIDVTGQMSGLELHHSIVEFAFQNGIDLKALEVDYPGIADPNEVGAWVESGLNFRWLCTYHHRGLAGAHTLAHADWSAGEYVPGLVATTEGDI